jgi:formylglycine-generating enzyme required for sulfatase activity
MQYPAMVSTFALDVYEVTVGRFRAFVNAGQGTQASPPAMGAGAHPQLAGSGWGSAWNPNLVANTASLTAGLKCSSVNYTWTDAVSGNENKPINCVTWYEAMAFCIWDGGYLPTEAEWNYAASGGSLQRVYPWSNPATSSIIDCSYANYQSCVSGGVSWAGSRAVGNGRWGHSDLAGNVREWVLDWYAGSYPMPCVNCASLSPDMNRLSRGGSIGYDPLYLRTSYRGQDSPGTRNQYLGFRCARN